MVAIPRGFEFREKRGIDEFLKLARSEAELRELVADLIKYRERLKESALDELEQEAERLLSRLMETERRILVEEIECFKDILRLQKRLIENDNVEEKLRKLAPINPRRADLGRLFYLTGDSGAAI